MLFASMITPLISNQVRSWCSKDPPVPWRDRRPRLGSARFSPKRLAKTARTMLAVLTTCDQPISGAVPLGGQLDVRGAVRIGYDKIVGMDGKRPITGGYLPRPNLDGPAISRHLVPSPNEAPFFQPAD